MPPKGAVAASPSPPPLSSVDAQDILVIADMVDTLDQIPSELTRVHSDLNELAAVLYSTLITLENKLKELVELVQDPNVGPEARFQLLQEIAEEAARYKLGGDDKIRVAGGACDGLMHHQKHISDLLEASTLLASGPPSPYTQSLTLSHPQPLPNTRRGVLARAANSPFGGRGYAAASGSGENTKERDTPSKKKKSRVAQLGVRDDDEISTAGSKKAPAKKRRPANRAISPTDSLASNSGFAGKPIEPRTARQLAAAANRDKAKRVEEEDSEDDEPGVKMHVTESTDSMLDRNGLGLDMGTQQRETSALGKSVNTASANGNASSSRGNGRARGGQKRSRPDEDEEEIDDEDAVNFKPAKKAVIKKTSQSGNQNGVPGRDFMADGDGGDADHDLTPYCICQSQSYGEMIGCDNDDCAIEWFHVACVGLSRPPEGDWTCPDCAERMRKNPNKKKSSKSKARK